MKPLAGFSLIALVVASAVVAGAASETPAQTGQQGTSSDQSSPEVQAITDLAKQYEEAYNAADAKKLAQ